MPNDRHFGTARPFKPQPFDDPSKDPFATQQAGRIITQSDTHDSKPFKDPFADLAEATTTAEEPNTQTPNSFTDPFSDLAESTTTAEEPDKDWGEGSNASYAGANIFTDSTPTPAPSMSEQATPPPSPQGSGAADEPLFGNAQGSGAADEPLFDSEQDSGAAEPTLSAQSKRWAWMEVDLKAIGHNINAVRKLLGIRTKIMAVVKADGYGHGAVEVAKTALTYGASQLGVSNVNEGVELRQAGIDREVPILVLSQPPATSVELLCHHALTPAVQSADFAIIYAEAADARGLSAPYHIKIDTGMHRVGVPAAEAAKLVQTLAFHRALQLKGTFTHLATADELESFEYSRQLKRFEAALQQMRQVGVDPGIVHAANSAATIRYREARYDMVRLGIAMYGLHPGKVTYPLIDLHPAMSIIARVTNVNNVPMGEGVGYGLTYRSPGNVLAATIPLGYADGMSRQLSNKTEVLCGGQVLPQIGRVNMDMTSFEVNQRNTIRNPRVDVEVGDEVVVVGRSGDLEITLDDLASQLGTINYELACRFGMRLERVYI